MEFSPNYTPIFGSFQGGVFKMKVRLANLTFILKKNLLK